MDYSGVLNNLLPSIGLNISATAGNNTTDNTPHAKVVESILGLVGLRGFAPIYAFIGNKLGIEPSYILTAIGVLWAFNKLFHQLYTGLYNIVISHFMCSIHILNSDDIYSHLMEWLASQPQIVNSRALLAETASKRAWEFEDASNLARDNSGRYLNFSNQEARAPPQYSPSIGLHGFWWKGQYFRLQRKRESVFDDTSIGQVLKDQEDIVISCFWRSPEPIKQLLAHAKAQYYRDHQARTIVKRPSMYNRRYAGRCSWHQVANRPVRDIRTVVLDEKQKLQVLADINEYLHPETPRWYANRGIPLRRGYLFYGPPGTGKTSLSFALAGIFGLDIHVISLLEPSLTEEDLSNIDTAGLRRPANKDADTDSDPSTSFSMPLNPKSYTKTSNAELKGDWKVSDLAKALKQEGDADRKTGISLSGLLNAIDGVASHEGRVLIMTTNTPEQLDDALIRPGRVDLQVAFANATQDQARELFIRMYEGTATPVCDSQTNGTTAPGTCSGSGVGVGCEGTGVANTAQITAKEMNGDAKEVNGSSLNDSGDLDIPVDELPVIAKEFGNKIPDSEFSPAQIQGYLLKRKKHPRKALDEVDMWVEGYIKQKKLKSKIMQVQ
ncbi:hypothetical protein ABKA04_001919 [Annulohypoxylon sp. FPYF3050]